MVITTVATIFGIRVIRKQYVDMHTKLGLCPNLCVVCGRDIDDGERYSLLTNKGSVLFENVLVHDSHFGSDSENEILIRDIIRKCP